MTRVRIDLFSSLDGYTAAPDPSADNPMGEDWGPLTAAYATETGLEPISVSVRTFFATRIEPLGPFSTDQPAFLQLWPNRVIRGCAHVKAQLARTKKLGTKGWAAPSSASVR